MKRTPLRRRIPLRSKNPDGLARKTALRPRSKKTATLYRTGRVPFVRDFLSRFRECGIRWGESCTRWAVDVHEYIRRSQGGAIVPGPEAKAQGQIFFPTCRNCHDEIGRHPKKAVERGYSFSRKYPDGGQENS